VRQERVDVAAQPGELVIITQQLERASERPALRGCGGEIVSVFEIRVDNLSGSDVFAVELLDGPGAEARERFDDASEVAREAS